MPDHSETPLPGHATVSYGPKTALLVVDVQNDFADPGGSLSVRGGQEVVRAVNDEIRAAQAAGALVVYTQDWHPPETPHFAAQGGPWPVHCVGGTWGAALHPDLIVAGPSIHKGTGGEDGYSGFTMRHPIDGDVRGTGLAELLFEYEIIDVVIVGLATDYCVRETAFDALRLGFGVTVLRRAVAAVDVAPGDGDRALADVAAAGATVL
jgi:nicotinamidase/pyrazinamidase